MATDVAVGLAVAGGVALGRTCVGEAATVGTGVSTCVKNPDRVCRDREGLFIQSEIPMAITARINADRMGELLRSDCILA